MSSKIEILAPKLKNITLAASCLFDSGIYLLILSCTFGNIALIKSLNSSLTLSKSVVTSPFLITLLSIALISSFITLNVLLFNSFCWSSFRPSAILLNWKPGSLDIAFDTIATSFCNCSFAIWSATSCSVLVLPLLIDSLTILSILKPSSSSKPMSVFSTYSDESFEALNWITSGDVRTPITASKAISAPMFLAIASFLVPFLELRSPVTGLIAGGKKYSLNLSAIVSGVILVSLSVSSDTLYFSFKTGPDFKFLTSMRSIFWAALAWLYDNFLSPKGL